MLVLLTTAAPDKISRPLGVQSSSPVQNFHIQNVLSEVAQVTNFTSIRVTTFSIIVLKMLNLILRYEVYFQDMFTQMSPFNAKSTRPKICQPEL